MNTPPTGNFLGDMTDELESYGRGSFIEAFVSGGPKFYAYVVQTADGHRHEICKIKGIKLNFENSRLLNFSSIKDLLISREREEEEEEKNNEERAATAVRLEFGAIRRNAFHDVITRREVKTCAPVLVKRRFINSRCSLSYGFV